MLGQDYILDASAVLAVLFAEEGADRVIELADLSFITGVTVAEVITKLRQKGVQDPEAVLAALQIEVDEVFSVKQAEACGKLHAETRGKKGGLSLADCICMAMAEWNGATAVTAEKEWPAAVMGRNIKVLVIR